MQIVLESKNLDVLEHGLRAMQALSTFLPAARAMACSSEFFVHIAELIRTGNIQVQQTSASLLTSLSPKEEIRRSMAECMPSLIKMLELPKPVSAQEIAAEALACLLSARPNRIEFSRDLKSMTKLVQMLDPRREEICKKFPVSVVLALAARRQRCRKRLT
ncbi:uncharacterized protein A4U43_C05F31920 [Asparagus officinalis]|uniref:Uncharacterized protein n=1 Tax=Asparagus officinalis TaxID=4686 RepID=A0A5P1EWH4_ASPOF|nr:uncharacterized protein LOC109841072 [Asparagus officinalis]ONK70262.1 uncharacterized protein A4U43_C05F31920 [Asparagus officinalis]